MLTSSSPRDKFENHCPDLRAVTSRSGYGRRGSPGPNCLGSTQARVLFGARGGLKACGPAGVSVAAGLAGKRSLWRRLHPAPAPEPAAGSRRWGATRRRRAARGLLTRPRSWRLDVPKGSWGPGTCRLLSTSTRAGSLLSSLLGPRSCDEGCEVHCEGRTEGNPKSRLNNSLSSSDIQDRGLRKWRRRRSES